MVWRWKYPCALAHRHRSPSKPAPDPRRQLQRCHVRQWPLDPKSPKQWQNFMEKTLVWRCLKNPLGFASFGDSCLAFFGHVTTRVQEIYFILTLDHYQIYVSCFPNSMKINHHHSTTTFPLSGKRHAVVVGKLVLFNPTSKKKNWIQKVDTKKIGTPAAVLIEKV